MRSKSLIRISEAAWIVFISILIPNYQACTGKQEEIVAESERFRITLDEFRIAYLDVIKKPNVFDSQANREKFLDELIASRLLAQEAEKRGYDQDEKLQYKTEAYLNKALCGAHFEKVIRPMFSISEEDIQDAYIFSQEQRRISHLISPTKEGIDSIYTLLRSGKTFEDLARTNFADTSMDQSGGDLGWVDWDQLGYDMAMTAFRLPSDSFSAPVKSQYGYHILKVTEFKKKPLITRAEFEAHRQKAKAKLEYVLGDKYAFEYIQAMMEKADIRVNPPVVFRVRSKLRDIFRRKPAGTGQPGEMQLTDNEVKLMETNLWDMRDETFASIDGKEYSVGEFLGALNYIPYEVSYKSFRSAMGYAFRDYLIEKEARVMGLETDDRVRYKYNLYREYLLQLALRRDLVRSAEVSEAEIMAFYQENRAKFGDAFFDQVAGIIRDHLLRKKRSDAVTQFLAQLPGNDGIKKYPAVINRYYDSIVNRN